MPPIRLNKLLVDRGVCSRREADRLIEQEEITIDGRPAILGEKVEGTEDIKVKGKSITREKGPAVYLAFHKPVGVICTSDPNANDNIIDAVGYPERLFHIGRLDVASSGLILLTNDGDIVNRILRAEEKHDKEYIVDVNERITDDFLYEMAHGVDIGDERKTIPCIITQLSYTSFSLVLTEGRNRQIRRMCDALGYSVKNLRRIRVMHIELGKLALGAWRHLSPAEEKELLLACKKEA